VLHNLLYLKITKIILEMSKNSSEEEPMNSRNLTMFSLNMKMMKLTKNYSKDSSMMKICPPKLEKPPKLQLNNWTLLLTLKTLKIPETIKLKLRSN